MSGNRGGPTYHAGRDIIAPYAEQGDAIANVNTVNNGGAADIDIIAELRALREIVGRLTPPDDAVAGLLTAAETEAKAEKPKKDRVVTLVESATKLATGANGFADQTDKLIPRLQQVAAWAGRAWDAWGPTLGF